MFSNRHRVLEAKQIEDQKHIEERFDRLDRRVCLLLIQKIRETKAKKISFLYVIMNL